MTLEQLIKKESMLTTLPTLCHRDFYLQVRSDEEFQKIIKKLQAIERGNASVVIYIYLSDPPESLVSSVFRQNNHYCTDENRGDCNTESRDDELGVVGSGYIDVRGLTDVADVRALELISNSRPFPNPIYLGFYRSDCHSDAYNNDGKCEIHFDFQSLALINAYREAKRIYALKGDIS